MPNVRTATMAVSRVRMTGRSLARTISQPGRRGQGHAGAEGGPADEACHDNAQRGAAHCPTSVLARPDLRCTCWSARATSSGRWVTTMTQRRSASRRDGLVREARRVGVEVRGGLVEEEHRGGGEQGAGQREARPLAGRQPEAVVAERGVEALGQGRDDALEAHDPQRLPHGGGPGAGAQRQGGADGAGGEERPLRHEVGRGRADLAALGGADAGESSSRVDLPVPDGPVTTVRPAPAVRSTPSRTGAAAPG